MKYLKIENNKGFYWDGKDYQEIDRINKDCLLVLLNAAETSDFELDSYNESLIENKAHQIIYANIYSKFEQFLNDKSQFKKEVDSLFEEAIGKYSVDVKKEEYDKIEDLESEESGEDVNPEEVPF